MQNEHSEGSENAIVKYLRDAADILEGLTVFSVKLLRFAGVVSGLVILRLLVHEALVLLG